MNKDETISANSLFHYTFCKDRLISILNNGFKPRYSLEKLGLLKKDALKEYFEKKLGKEITMEDVSDEFAIPMCCFCDIPLNLVGNHIMIYGEYSIGLDKSWGEQNAICPVMYVPLGGDSRFLFELIVSFTQRLLPVIQKKYTQFKKPPVEDCNLNEDISIISWMQYVDSVINLTMYIKPYQGFYERAFPEFRNENYKFYDEREWRYIPKYFLERKFLYKDEFEKSEFLARHNDSLGHVSFNMEDITDIIVPDYEVNQFREIVSRIERLKDFDLSKIDTITNRIKRNYSLR